MRGRELSLTIKDNKQNNHAYNHICSSRSTDFIFNVTEITEGPGQVQVDLYTNKRYHKLGNKPNPISTVKSHLFIRFKGILVTTNFGPNNNGPDLSLGQWFGSSSMGLFRTMNSYCGITHRNREPKTGKHSFFFSPLPVGNLKWKRTGFRAIIVVNVNRVHDFFIPGAE